MASVHIDQIKDSHFIAFLFQQTANVTDNFSFRIKDDERGIALHGIGLTEKPCFSCAGTAAY